MRSAAPMWVLSMAAAAAAQPCPEVGPMKSGFGLSAPAQHAAVFDEDGAGPDPARLFLSGPFMMAAGGSAPGLARWDGDALSAVAGTPAGPKGAMRVFDDGSGLALYAAGDPGVIHRYRGAGVWDTLAVPQFSGLDGSPESFTVFDPDGQGPRPLGLFALVNYPGLLGEATSVLWRYDAQGWGRLSGPVGSGKIIVYDSDGAAGPGAWDLYHIFNVTRSNPERTVGYVRRLHPDHWELITQTAGLAASPAIGDAAVFHNSVTAPPVLVLTGAFGNLWRPGIGYISAARVGTWDGQTIVGFPNIPGRTFHGTALAPLYGGGEPRLLVGGIPLNNAVPNALFSGAWEAGAPSDWPIFGGGVIADSISAVREFDPDSAGPRPAQAVVLGEIDLADNTPLKDFGAFAPGEGWSGGLQTIRGAVYSLQVFNDGTGRRLFAAGSFRVGPAGEHETILRWSGSEWEVPGGGPGLVPNSSMRSLTVHNDGSGWALYGVASEPVPNSYYLHTSRIARWDGHAWSYLTPTGASLNNPLAGGGFTALASHDVDGVGPIPARLYAAGNFEQIDGTQVRDLAVWDGASWSSVPGYSQGTIYVLKSLNDGEGPALYVGGFAPGVPQYSPNQAFKLTAGGWRELPLLTQFTVPYDFALETTTGAARLVVLGLEFGHGFHVLRRTEAGDDWEDLLPPEDLGTQALRNVQDADGPALYAGRYRYTAGGWEPLDPAPYERFYFGAGPTYTPVWAISPPFDDGSGPSVFLGGRFNRLGAPGDFVGTGPVARARICLAPLSAGCYANCDGSEAEPRLNASDLTCFLQRFAAGDARANCDGSGVEPVLNVADFACFVQRFAAGCR